MRELFFELALRLPKVIIATFIAVLAYAIATGIGGAAPTVAAIRRASVRGPRGAR